MPRKAIAMLVWAIAAIWAVPALAAPLEACGRTLDVPEQFDGRTSALCGFNLPEDFAMTPNSRHIIVGDLGMEITPEGVKLPTTPHELTVVDTATDVANVLPRVRDDGPNWGDPACAMRDPKGPFFALGMNIAEREPGVAQLTLISAIGGEHVEFYQLVEADGRLQAAWRGCVDMPGDGALDAVALLPGGGFVASIIYRTATDFDAAVKASEAGEPTGWLTEWTPQDGLRRLPNSDGRLNNGVLPSADGTRIYMLETGTRLLKVYSRAQEKFVGSTKLPFGPDNMKQAADGAILIGGTSSTRLCLGKADQGCTNEAWVARWHPDTGGVDILFHAPDGLLSGTTGGLIANGNLYIASLSDPFLLKVRLTP